MFTKRKSEETDAKNAKKMKMNFSLYIERKREKMMLEEESPESIQNYLSETLRRLEDFLLTSFHFNSYPEYVPMGTYTTVNINGLQPSIDALSAFCSPSSSSDLYMLNSIGPGADSHDGMVRVDLHPRDNRNPSSPVSLSHTSRGSYQSPSQHSHTGTTQSFNMRPDLTESPHVRNAFATLVSRYGSKMLNGITLMTLLIDVVREWNFVVYKNCMDEYNVLRGNDPEFWDTMILKALPSAMVNHCVKANIVADFFHIMCIDLKRIAAVVKIKPSYLEFFLMNMAAVNRIECSLVVETDQWNYAKHELVERAFVAGQVSNLKLLLQYFQPADLWSNADMKFLKVRTVNSEARANNMDSVASGYYNNLTLLNLVRVATYVSESEVPKDILSDCIRLFWRASETPYASLADIEDAFKPLSRSLLLRHTLMRAFKDQLLGAYPRECLVQYQPRSLMHLSRCKIRQTITSVVFLPSLPLPSRLKCYLNLDM